MEVLIGLLIIGFILWLVETKIAMPDYILNLIRLVVVIYVIYWLLRFLPANPFR